jgi:hypothetical protein
MPAPRTTIFFTVAPPLFQSADLPKYLSRLEGKIPAFQELTLRGIHMIRFHRNGLMVMLDSEGKAHILDSKESLKDIATYVWQNESLKDYRISGDDSLKEIKEIIFVELGREKEPRLRSLSSDDKYYNDSL